jgi:hypothetical protein
VGETVSQQHISLTADVAAYFEAALSEAVKSCGVRASEAALGYLAALLTDFARPGWQSGAGGEQPLTFRLRDALAAAGAERFKRLREIGDEILYALGFFAAHVTRHGADREYLLGIGANAYDHAAAMLRIGRGVPAGPEVLGELAAQYDRYVLVLNEVADSVSANGTSPRDDRAVLRLYERWRRTGSQTLAERLGSLGLVPTGGGRGLQ